MFSNKDIAKHFEVCEEHYRYWWNLRESKSMHYGYWDATTKNLHDALMNINKVMSNKVMISANDHVLDAGCGVGGSSLWLAKTIGCRVTGITLSEKQRKQAEETAIQQGFGNIVNFYQDDYTKTRFPNASFDVIWAIESVCYAEDKQQFLQEAYRLLKPGGRIIVADFFKIPGLEGKEKELIAKMAYGWAISDFATIEDFIQQAQKTVFTNIVVEDASIPITPSARRLYIYSFPGMFFSKLYAVFYNPTELSKKHARTVYLQYKGLKKSLWKYQIFQAVKEK